MRQSRQSALQRLICGGSLVLFRRGEFRESPFWLEIQGLAELAPPIREMNSNSTNGPAPKFRWLNRTVLGIGLASLLSDWSHEIATTVLPAFLASMGAAAAWLGVIEGVADGLSSFAKMASGFYTDKLQRRKPIAVAGYLVTALGTASFGLATAAWHILISRSLAWLGRGVRTPVRKALLAAAVTKETYGRAFGFERMMDTVGAIVGPATAFVLLAALKHNYRHIFLLTLIPGICAAGLIAFFVREKERQPVAHVSFGQRLRLLPRPYRKFLVAVGIFGAGDFAPSLLILLATQKLAPALGLTMAASIAVGLYVLRNTYYAGFAYVAGWLADHFKKQYVLASGYALAAVMALLIVAVPMTIGLLAIIFILSGMHVAIGETLEDSFCAELVGEEQHGMAFGVLATVNGIGDFLSSIIVGVLWTAKGTSVAFGYSAILFSLGALLVLRTNRSR
jgi:MFS family permease